jgi:hypothetical protein
VDLGYDRSIPPWEPTPARLIPTLNPVTVAGDLINAIGEGVNNALAVVGSAAPVSIPAPFTEIAQPDVSEQTAPTPGKQTSDPGQVTSEKSAAEPDQTTSGKQTTDVDQTTSTTVSRSQLVKRTGTPATHRPSERVSLGVSGQPIRERLQRGNGHQPTTQTPPSAGSASGGGSSDGDADGS